MASLFGILENVPYIGDTLKDVSGKTGLETAAQGAKDAQAQANALAQLQWQRQMAGLQEARGQTQPYLSLYDKIYGTQMAGRQMPVNGMGASFSGATAGYGPPGSNLKQPEGLLKPDGTRTPPNNSPLGFGAGILATTDKAQHAPIMRGSPPAPTQSAMTMQSPMSMQTPQLNPQQSQYSLEDLLRRLRGGM